MSVLNNSSLSPKILFRNFRNPSLWEPLLTQDDDTVTVRRRRGSGSTSSAERERADTPSRDRPPSGGGGSSSGGGGGGGTPSGRRPISGGPKIPGGPLGLVAIIVIVIFSIFFRGGGSDEANPSDVNPPAQEAQGSTPASSSSNPTPTLNVAANPTQPPGVAGAQTWTVLLYQDADDKVLEKDIYVDLNEAERVGSTPNVNIIAQVDRFQGGFAEDGDWTSAKRFYVTHDEDLGRVGSEEVQDLGEINMADADTLVDFVTWGIATYPADKYVLILSDHGMGWPGGWSDPTASRLNSSVPLEARVSDLLFMNEIDAALQAIRDQSGLDKFELVGMDACLMAHLEVFAALEPHARYAVASQETEPALGWAYTSFLGALAADPDMDGAQLGQAIVDSYISEDQRVVDDQARADFAGRGQPTGNIFDLLLGGAGGASSGVPTADQVAQQLEQNITLAAVDLAAIPQLIESVNDLALSLQEVDQKSVAKARSYAQAFTSVFGKQVPPSYIDIGHFVGLFKQAGVSGDLGTSVDEVLAALDQSIIGEKHGPKLPGATGISIYFPTSQLYGSPEAGPRSYTAIADRFSEESVWDDYLAFHYTGRTFEADTRSMVVPESSAEVRGPGGGAITVAPVTLSAATTAPGRPIVVSTHIEGTNIGYVYFFLGYYDSAANSIYTVDMDYLESDQVSELNGVYYPVWPEDGSFNMEFEWEPIFFAMSDGTNNATALFQPVTFGAEQADATYTVEGTYTFGDDGSSQAARLYFSDGILRQVFGFNGDDNVGAPAEITPASGDTFTINEEWRDLDQNGNIINIATEAGETLTFGDQTFTWLEQDAAAGEYVIGFIVEDLDGNKTQTFTQVVVE